MTDFSIGGCNVRHVRFQFDRSAVVIRRRAANWYHLDFSNAHSNPARPRGNPAPAEGDRAAYWRQALIPGPAVVRVAWTCSVSYYLDHDVPPQHRCAARGWLRAAVWCRHDPAASCARRADVSRLARRGSGLPVGGPRNTPTSRRPGHQTDAFTSRAMARSPASPMSRLNSFTYSAMCAAHTSSESSCEFART